MLKSQISPYILYCLRFGFFLKQCRRIYICALVGAISNPVIITMRDVGVFLRSTEKALRFFAFSSIVLSEDTLDVSKYN